MFTTPRLVRQPRALRFASPATRSRRRSRLYLPRAASCRACRMLDKEMLSRQQRLLKEVQTNKQTLLSILENRPFILDIWPGEANFVLIRCTRATELLSFCAARGVILRGYPDDPSLAACIRISVGSEQDLSALQSALDAWEEQA